MAEIKAVEGQDLFDITIQEYGILDNFFDLIADNPQLFSPTGNDKLETGETVIINSTDKGVAANKSFFSSRKLKSIFVVNSDSYIEEGNLLLSGALPPGNNEGVGFWIIENDNEVQ